MKNFFLLILIVFTHKQLYSQNNPVHEGDSVRYEGKLYSLIWYDGFNKGESNGRISQYNIQRFGDSLYFVDLDYSSRTLVSLEWVSGYNEGYGKAMQTNSQDTNPFQKPDSVMYEGRWVTRSWYDTHVDYQTSFMPGFSYNFFFPNAQDSLGYFQGIGIEYLFHAVVTQNDNPGPSHVRFYGRLNLLKSSRSGINDAFAYTLGIDLSLEKNPKRSFLVPYFGLEAGGISQKQIGTVLQFTPTFGLHILSKKNIFAGIQGGYVYPTKKFDELRGYSIQASLNMAFW